MVIDEQADARKQPLAGEEAWQFLASAGEILVAKGKKVQVFNPQKDDKATILAATLGRTGNLRAPTLRKGTRLLVGFSEALYSDLSAHLTGKN